MTQRRRRRGGDPEEETRRRRRRRKRDNTKILQPQHRGWGKIFANLELDKKHPKIQQKSIWGGSWVLFGKGLGPSWASFGCFWPPLGRFLNVQNRTSFKHWPKMGSKRASGWILGRFGRILGRFWEDLGILKWDPCAASLRPAERHILSNLLINL